MSTKYDYRGFTLIECTLTLLLLSLMAIVAVSVMSIFRWKSEQNSIQQTDLLNAVSCMERIRAIYKTQGETVLFDNIKNLPCRGSPLITLTPLKTDQPPAENSGFKNIISNIVPDKSISSCDSSLLCLITVKSGSIEFYYVVGKYYDNY